MKTMNRNIIFIGAITVFLFSSCANMYLSKGTEDLENLNYIDAISSLEKSVEKKASFEGSTLLAQAYSATDQPVAAVAEFEKVSADPKFTDENRLDFASALLGAKRYDEAKEIADGILSRDPGNQMAQSIQISANRVDKMMKDSSLFQLTQKNIEGLAEALSPIVLENGNMIVSGEKNDIKLDKDEYTGYSYLDLYEIDAEGNMSKLDVSDSKYHDGMAVFTKDMNTMFFTRTNITSNDKLDYNEGYFSHPQLYMATKSGDSWSEPEKLPFNDPNFKFAHPALSSDGQTLYFSSDMEEGSGGMDLYKVTKTGSGWGNPVNLGPEINAPGNEVFPTLKDDNTLYFSSDSHETLGGLDLMYSKMSGNSWGAPVHLSYPLNSSMDDFGMVYTDDMKGLLTSSRSGNDNIYEFEEFYPELVIDGKTLELESLEPIPGIQLTIKNLTDNTTEVIVADENGKFSYDLLPNKEYEIIAEDISENQSYFNASQSISTIGLRNDETFDIAFNLEKIVVTDPDDPFASITDEDGRYQIPNIHWDYNKWDVRKDAEPYLNMVADLLELNPNLKVEIRSHCDSRGSKGFNKNLSKKRAKAVMKYLIAKGIERNRLTSKGMGESELLNDCSDGTTCTEEQHQENRRSDFLVVDKKGNTTILDQ